MHSTFNFVTLLLDHADCWSGSITTLSCTGTTQEHHSGMVIMWWNTSCITSDMPYRLLYGMTLAMTLSDSGHLHWHAKRCGWKVFLVPKRQTTNLQMHAMSMCCPNELNMLNLVRWKVRSAHNMTLFPLYQFGWSNYLMYIQTIVWQGSQSSPSACLYITNPTSIHLPARPRLYTQGAWKQYVLQLVTEIQRGINFRVEPASKPSNANHAITDFKVHQRS